MPGLLALALAVAGGVLMLPSGCGRVSADCSNGACTCPRGARCDFSCGAPPCHANCSGDNAQCNGECANGNCVCGSNSSCSFICNSAPCHITCADHTSCRGECANGQCTCGPNSNCVFHCLTSPCHTSCAGGSSCLVRCPSNVAGTPACDIVACGAGQPVVCPGGEVLTCGMACPK